eukprot:7057719-Lingulodinium_polyedra.AAC.1
MDSGLAQYGTRCIKASMGNKTWPQSTTRYNGPDQLLVASLNHQPALLEDRPRPTAPNTSPLSRCPGPRRPATPRLDACSGNTGGP